MRSLIRSFITIICCLAASALMAIPVNITIADGQGAGNLGVGREDNEVEPGNIISDAWDLEAFGYTPVSHQLDLIGTYDFKNGAWGDGHLFKAGAIFFGTTANVWTYACVLDFAKGTYTLYDQFNTIAPYYSQNSASGPWSISVTTAAHAVATGSFTYLTGLCNPDGFGLQTFQTGIKHNEIQLNLGVLDTLSPGILDNFYVHNTIQCGNDNINGHYQALPDSVATAGLLSAGVLAILVVRRYFRPVAHVRQ